MKTEPEIRTLGAGKFKATCLQLMDEVLDKGLTVIITKRGKPVAQLSAPTVEPPTKPAKPAKTPKAPKTPKSPKTKAAESAPVAELAASSAPTEEKHGKKKDKDKSKKKKHK